LSFTVEGSHGLSALSGYAQVAFARDAAMPALEYEGRWYSWGDFSRLRAELNGLLAETGVPDNAPVVMILRNRPSAVAALLSLIADGRTLKMVYAFQSGAAIASNLAALDPAVVIGHDGCLEGEALEWIRSANVTAIALDEFSARTVHVGKQPGSALSKQAQPASIHILTSGTTGLPKQIPFTHDFFATHHVAPKLAAGDTQFWQKEVPFLLTFPISNITGMFTFLPTLLSGQRAILADRFSLDVWLDWVRRFRPKNAGLPPAGIQMILDADVPKEALSGVTFIGTGAAPLDPEVQRRFEERYQIPVLISYGATEFGGPVTAMTPELYAQYGAAKRGSVGRPMPGVELRVLHPETGAVLPAGEEGILEVYVPRIGGKWVRTSDIACIDADGFLYHRGRADGAIMRGGFKIVPEVIERHLRQLPGISDVAVVGRRDHRLGEVPVAALVMKPGATRIDPAALDTFIRQHVPATHVPVAWRFLDALPRNPSFKLDRLALIALMQDGTDEA
jgi:acyl-coenzyme A synthetase/AMP-(fatty) acid ligase